MLQKLSEINRKPKPFETYTAESLWADEYRSQQMLAYHLDQDIDLSSRKTEFIDRSAAWIIDRFDLGRGKSVCDFGCGPGLYASRLAKSGANVTGLDFSENSIRYATKQAANDGQNIDYIKVNYLEFETDEKFDLITMIMCDFSVLSPAQRKILLNRFYGILKETGAILMDVHSTAGYSDVTEATSYEKNQLNHFWCADDYYCFVNTFKYDDELVTLDKYSIFQENGDAETVYNWLQYFSPESLSEELSEAGFDVTHIYKDVAGRAYSEKHSEFAVVAIKQP